MADEVREPRKGWTVQVFHSFEEAEAANDAQYDALTPDERVALLRDMIESGAWRYPAVSSAEYRTYEVVDISVS